MTPEFEISTDPARLDVDVIHGFLQTSYWAAQRRRAVVERAVRNSLCFGAYSGGQQVGFARVVSDRAVFAYIMDVFVLPPFGVILMGIGGFIWIQKDTHYANELQRNGYLPDKQ